MVFLRDLPFSPFTIGSAQNEWNNLDVPYVLQFYIISSKCLLYGGFTYTGGDFLLRGPPVNIQIQSTGHLINFWGLISLTVSSDEIHDGMNLELYYSWYKATHSISFHHQTISSSSLMEQ